MTYNPNIHHRRSIRLKGYDYSKEGLYFVTICVQHRECLFGEIKNGTMYKNPSGEMIDKWITETTNKFNNVEIPSFIVMPNHVHVIFTVGADLRVCPSPVPLECIRRDNNQGEHIGSPLQWVVQWFKTMTTNDYIRGVKTMDWKPFDKKLWQRNYYEHIIQNEQSYMKISEYIQNNPKKWTDDKMYVP